ncbi:MAG: hypothetical protein M3Z82_05800, partial [Apilactobacillus sp.]|nr:hypothetical protein [Apilactobacillus sp.]
MQYNKNQFNKVKDKKVMKKVKKQWVVVSVATLAALGTTVYSFGGHDAHADSNGSSSSNGTQSNNNNTNQSNGSSGANVSLTKADSTGTSSQGTTTQNAASSSSTTAQSGTAAQSSGTTASKPVVAVSSSSNGQAPSYNNNDDSVTYAQQIQQGYQDAYNGKSNNASTLTGQAINYYNAGYNAATAVINDYNQKTQGIGAGTQDYTYYGNTPNRKDDAGNVKTASLSSSGASLANNTPAANNVASSNSNGGSSGASASNGSGFTGASTTNPQVALTDGTPQNYNSPDSPYRGGADTPYAAYTSTQNYEQQLLSKFSNVNNVSVQSSSSIKPTIIPQVTDAVIQQARQQYANYTGLAKAFDTAVNMTLAMQGYSDAESGKWVGIAPGQASSGNQDFYVKSFSGIRNSNNAYDQAYMGAKDSIANSFDSSNNFKVNTAFNPVNTSNQYYNMGYNDVVSQETAKGSGVVFVSNGGQFFNVLTGQTGAMNAGGGNVANNIIKIKIVGDIDLTALTGTGGEYANINATGSSITIDGQNHMMDFHDMDYTFTNSNFTDLYLQNFQALYAANYYGPFRVGANDNIHYSNINYIGGQLLSATSQNVYFSGNVNVLNPVNYNNLAKSAYYNSPFTQNVLTVGGGNQQNLEVQNFVLENNSHYFGNTSPVYGGNVIELYGNMTLGQNSKMTLASRDTGGQGENGINSSNMAIYFRSSSANLNVAKDAVLNIIPLASQTANRLSGGIYMSGGNITVDGGTINFQAYNGTAGYYNQAIDMQGASTIKVINGGLVKVLEAGLPQTTGTYYTSGGRQATLYGLIANENNNGNFYVGNGGNLIVGLTDQNGGYVTPYYGNLTINGVGSDHVIFYNNNTTNNTFQTGGNQKGINAYNVGILDSSNRITPLYYFNLPSGSVNYTGVDGSGNLVSGTVNTTQLEIQSIPAVQFVGTSGVSVDNNGNTVITSYAKLTNYNSILGQKLYYQVGYGSTDPQGNFNNLTTYPNSSTQDLYSNADPNLYTGAINVPTNYAGEIIPVTFVLQKSATGNINPQFIGMRLKYGLTSVNNIVNTSPTAGTNNYTTTIEGYNTGANGKVTENGDMGITAGSTVVQQNGVIDGLIDASNGNSSAKNAESFSTRTSTDYTGAYNDAQSGYAAFNKNAPLSLDDLKKSPGFSASVNPVAYIQGYQKAAYDAGVSDAHFGITSPQLQNIAGYQDGVNQYNQAYLVGLDPSKASLPLSTLQSQYGLASTYLGIPATATTTGLSDAQGALSFVQDERNAIINSTSGGYGTVLSNPTQKNAYLDAEAGYFNAVKNVSNPTAANPNPNASKAEQAGFQYGQSLINGALAKQKPTVANPSAGIYNLAAAQSAFDAVQAALIHAAANASSEAGTTSHDALSDDSYVGDKTVYKSIKYGYYKANQGQTDINLTGQTESKLDLLEEAGYILYVQPLAYQSGTSAFNNKQSNTANNNPYSNSTVGQQAFNNGYTDAQSAFNQGQTDGLNTVKSSSNPQSVDSNTSSIPSNYNDKGNLAASYQTGYKGAVDGYKDGVSSTTGSSANNNSTGSTANYATSYQNGNAQGREQAGANDYVNNTVSQTVANSDTNYATGVNTAAQGHTDGYTTASNQPGNQNITTNNTDKTYVTGFNSGVADQRSDATKNGDAQAFAQGAQDYTNNLPISVSGHEKYYITYYNQGYNAARQGLLDARDGKQQNLPTFMPSANKNDPTYVNSSAILQQFTDALQAAYKQGYTSFNNGNGQNDATSGFSDSNNALANGQTALAANDTTKSVAYNVAADIFNTQLSSLQGTSYTNKSSTSGNMYIDLQNWFNARAQADYQAGENVAKKTTVAPTTSNPANQNYFGIVQAGFNDLTNGYNGTTGSAVNTKSQGYTDGQLQKQQLNTGISTAINSVKNNAPSDPDQLDAYNGTIAGYNDRATGSITGSSSINSTYDKVFVDAYNKAYSDGANLASDAKNQLSLNQTATDATLNADGAKNSAYTAAYNQLLDGYHSVLGMTTGSTPSTNANYQNGQVIGRTFMSDYNAAEAKSNPKVSDSTSQT